jgi:undecaprenyl-diphosphatase
MPEIIKVILLSIIQGITEFLPISSTGHLIVFGSFLELNATYRDTFNIFIQLGSVVAVIAFYREELFAQVKTVVTNDENMPKVLRFWALLLVAFIPAATVGVLFSDWIEANLLRPQTVALALIVGGILFIIVERLRPTPVSTQTRAEALEEAMSITFMQALMIGLWQIIALFPGSSRSGMTIIGGMLAGLKRSTVMLFTFYLAIPTLGAATVYSLVRALDTLSTEGLLFLIIGAILSAVVSWFSIAWLLRYVSQHTFIPFGVYRIVLGVIILVVFASGLLQS